jgi:glucans biosynthesis protein
MSNLNRRAVLAAVIAASGARWFSPAVAQPSAAGGPAAAGPPAAPRFGYEDVVKRAKELAAAPFDARVAPLPDGLQHLDFDAWRDIRFRPDKALLGQDGGPFRLQLFHLGHLYTRPVTVNILRDGIPAPVPYAANLFDYGRNKFDATLPINLGFAGFRLHYPLNSPKVMDEVIAFLGASYYRFLGRGQRYGLSARSLGINSGIGQNEEFPFFREFWIDEPGPGAQRAIVHGLLDGESATGAFRFEIYPGQETTIEITATIIARRDIPTLDMAPLSSMFLLGKNDHRITDDFRNELHDSDGLLIHNGSGEWIWRPLSNPTQPELSTFLDKDIHAFGLLQRDRTFADYQDLDLAYELRPSYWIEPRENWGEGRIELVELPTTDESNDNIVASWVPKDPVPAGRVLTYGYRITALMDDSRLSPGARAVSTYRTHPRALGSAEPLAPGSTRFIIDFSGGDLAYYEADPSLVEVVPSASNGHITRFFLTSNPYVRGFRAGIDVQIEPGQSCDLRTFLKSGAHALTETWTFPWRA